MDFPPEDIGPYNPYVDFSLENVGRTTQKRPYEEKSDGNKSKIQKSYENSEISKSSLYQFPILPNSRKFKFMEKKQTVCFR